MSKKSKYVIDGRDPGPGEAAVYLLRDPVTGEVRYVGRTKNGLLPRLRGHWKQAAGSGLVAWRDTLEMPPRLEAVMYVPVEQGNYWEGVIIAGLLAQDARLVNTWKTQEMCGTKNGYKYHVRAGTEVCRPCRQVNNAERRKRRATPEGKAIRNAQDRRRRSTDEYRERRNAKDRARRARRKEQA